MTNSPIDHSHHAHSGAGASEHDEHGAAFWIALVIGLGILGFGVRGVVRTFHTAEARFVFGRYIVASDLWHDLVIAPTTFIAAWITSRVAPRWLRPPLTFAGFAAAITLAIAWRPLHGTAHYKQNPSFQPLNYATALATVYAVIGVITIAWAAVRFRARERAAS